jgi:hypothetical protein
MKFGLVLMEESRLYVFENMVYRMFGYRREELVGSWRKLHYEKVHNTDSSQNVIRVISQNGQNK